MYCEECDEAIPPRRRELIPGVTTCVTCQSFCKKWGFLSAVVVNEGLTDAVIGMLDSYSRIYRRIGMVDNLMPIIPLIARTIQQCK